MSVLSQLQPARILFYLPDEKNLKFAQSLVNEVNQTDIQADIVYTDSEALMLEKATESSLVVSFGSATGRLGTLLYHTGIPFHLSLPEFQMYWPSFFQKNQKGTPGTIILAYLSNHVERISASMAQLYGYEVITVHSIQDLQKVLKGMPSHLVFDQDMPNIKHKTSQDNRETVFRHLKSARRQNPRFSVSVIKDFDQGSLFEDLGSSVKDVTPALLSPEEFLTFFRSLLFDYNYERITRQMNESIAEYANFSPYGRNRAPLFSHLSDLKRCFQFSESVQRKIVNDHRLRHFQELELLFFKDSMLNWMQEVFAREAAENKIERGALVFFERQDGVTVSLNSLPPLKMNATDLNASQISDPSSEI